MQEIGVGEGKGEGNTWRERVRIIEEGDEARRKKRRRKEW